MDDFPAEWRMLHEERYELAMENSQAKAWMNGGRPNWKRPLKRSVQDTRDNWDLSILSIDFIEANRILRYDQYIPAFALTPSFFLACC